tara:strand:- start:343 stop:567 length:225 start_codon:yes stop_codon:yes gene_type:complete
MIKAKTPMEKKKKLTAWGVSKCSRVINGITVIIMERCKGSKVNKTENATVEGDAKMLEICDNLLTLIFSPNTVA